MSEDVVQSLKQTVVRLEKELESYKSRDVKRREQLGAGFVWLAKVLARRDLRVAAKAWWSKFQETKPELPGEESVLLLGAFGNRVLTVGLFGAVVAAFPALLLLTQTGLLAYQNYQFGIESAAARRAQLIATLYDKECLWSEETPIEADEGASEDVESTSTPNEASNKSVDERCRPVASVRARSEAVVALHQMGGRDFKKADLHDADFREADLWEADFRWADLRDAGFRDANLEGATLREANLRGADLEGANLRMARLEGASLREADLEGVHLEVARLEGARLEGARLEGARL
ncbi:MAG: pentapeptide repeat-containing protein, partial [Myxococcota bacterium]